jgi:hypothetical protein
VLANPDQLLSQAQAREANAIDNLCTQAMLGAEKKCRKLQMGNIPYSLATATIGNEIRYWAAVVKRILHQHISFTHLKFLKKKAGITEPTGHFTLEYVNEPAADARKCFRQAKTDAPASRESYLQTLPPNMRKHYLRVEVQRRQGLVACAINGKLNGSSVSMGMMHDTQGNQIKCSTKATIESAAIKANQNKYSQSDVTPPMQPYFVNDFGNDDNTPAVDAALDGTYIPPPECDPVLKDFLAHCKRMPEIPTECCPCHIHP